MWDKEMLRRLTQPMTVKQLQCGMCKFYTGANQERVLTCKVFPKGIPSDLLYERANHFKENYPGDNGILGRPRTK